MSDISKEGKTIILSSHNPVQLQGDQYRRIVIKRNDESADEIFNEYKEKGWFSDLNIKNSEGCKLLFGGKTKMREEHGTFQGKNPDGTKK